MNCFLGGGGGFGCSSRILRSAWSVRTGLTCGSVEEPDVEAEEAESSSIGGVMERLGGGVVIRRGGGGGERE